MYLEDLPIRAQIIKNRKKKKGNTPLDDDKISIYFLHDPVL
jgi:hypothetical protein